MHYSTLIIRAFYVIITLIITTISQAQITPSGPLSYSGQSNIVIENKSFTSGAGGAAIKLTNCTNVLIRNCTFDDIPNDIGVQANGCSNIEVTGCDFEQFRSGVYCINSSQLNIHCNSFRDIAGTYPRGQIVQFNQCFGTGNRVNYNTSDHTFGTGDPEDLINMYASGGTVADPLQIIGNKLRGGGPSNSGGGIMVGDDDGHDIIVEDNILVDPGQYGIGCPAGENITIRNNMVFGRQQSFTNVGIYVGLQGEINAGHACVAHTLTVEGNLVNWKRDDGVNNGFYNCPCCSGINKSGNDFKANIDASILPATLTLDNTACGSSNNGNGNGSGLCTAGMPAGYQEIECLNFETNNKAADYIGNDAWYYYWGGGSPSNNNHPELDNRFKIVTDPADANNQVIELTKFDGDQDYSNSNPPLNPRTELSFRPSLERPADKEVYFRLKTYFPASQANVFSAEFIQFWLHGSSNIPIQIEVRNGQFAARNPRLPSNEQKSPFTGKMLNDYLDQWITWEVRAKFNNNGGYWDIYMNGELVYSHAKDMSQWPSNEGDWHPQFGAYANNGGNGNMQILFDDFLVAEKNGIITMPTEITDVSLTEADPQTAIAGYEDLTATDNIYKTMITASEFNINVDTEGDVDSVVFVHTSSDGTYSRTEGTAPYALRSDGPGYQSWNLTEGDHMITINVYHGGVSQDDVQLEFTVLDNVVVLSPIDDAYMQGTTGYNTADLRVEAGNRTSYLKFDLSSITGNVISAQLDIAVGSDAGSGTVNLLEGIGNNWTETTIDNSNAPTTGTNLGSNTGNFDSGDVLSFDLLGHINTAGTYSFVLEQEQGGNDVAFASDESGNGPKLIIATGAVTGIWNGNASGDMPYPNPCTDKLSLPDNFTASHVSNLQGLEMGIILEDNSINTSSFPSGVYFLTGNQKKEQVTIKFLKQ